MEFRETLERIVDMCNGRETCDGCALDWGKCALDYVPCEARPSDIDKICKAVEQMEQEEQSIENAQMYVINHLDARTKLEQLAEEAAELSQAALKLIRAKRLSNNVTPTDEKEALANVREDQCLMARKWLITTDMYLNIDKILAVEILNTGRYWGINIITDSKNEYIYDNRSYLSYEEAKQALDELIKTLCS